MSVRFSNKKIGGAISTFIPKKKKKKKVLHEVSAGAEVRVLETTHERVKLVAGGTALHAERDLDKDQEEGNDPSDKGPSNLEVEDTEQNQCWQVKKIKNKKQRK